MSRDALLDAVTSLRIARDRLATSKREKARRVDLAIEWMRQKSTRTLGEANAYVGIKSINDEIAEHRADLREAVDSLLGLSVDLEARKAGGK